MKAQTMKAPGLEQIFSQRYQYEQHKKKLMKIYEERRANLGIDNDRMEHFQHIKEGKTRSFMSKFNKTSLDIAKDNLKLLGKLEKAKPSLKSTSPASSRKRERSTLSYITPFHKQRIIETEKQNSRMCNRMKNLASSINQKQFIREYAKSQQIKNRLMRYSSDSTKVYLKSERYLGEDHQSHVSQDRESGLKSEKGQKDNKLNKFSIRSGLVKPGTNYYNRGDILKNKVDISTSNLTGIKQKHLRNRPNTSMDSKGQTHEQDGSFFTTEPRKPNTKVLRRKTKLVCD